MKKTATFSSGQPLEADYAGHAGETCIPFLEPVIRLEIVGVDQCDAGIGSFFEFWKRGITDGDRVTRVAVERENRAALAFLDFAIRKNPPASRASDDIGDVAVHPEDFAQLLEVWDVAR